MSRSNLQQIITLQWQQLLFAKRFLKKDVGRVAVALAFVLLSLAVMLGMYFVARTFFHYFSLQEAVLKEVLFLESFNSYFFFLGLLLTVGSVFTAHTLFFSDKRNQFLFSLPLSPSVIYWATIIRVWGLNCLGMIILGIPVMVAYGNVWKFTILYYVFVVAVVFLLSFATTLLGSTLLLLAHLILPGRKSGVFVGLVFGGILGGAFLIAQLLTPSVEYFSQLASKEVFLLDEARRFSLLFPSTWIAEVFLSFLIGNHRFLVLEYLLLCLTPCILLLLSLWLGKRHFYLLWSRSLEHSPSYKGNEGEQELHFQGKKTIFSLTRKRIDTIVAKEVLIFVRKVVHFSKSSFLLLLFFIPLLLLSFADKDNLSALWQSRIVGLIYAVFGYLFATLALYFVFPAVSNEGKTLWLLLSSPVKKGQIFLAKILPWVVLFLPLVLGVFLFLLQDYLFKMNELIAMLVLALVGAITILAFTYAMGAAFPLFQQSDPELASTSIQGIVVTFVNLVYVGVLSFCVSLFAERIFIDHIFAFDLFMLMTIISLFLAFCALFLSYYRFKIKLQ